MKNELLFCIKAALSSLNQERGGDRKFEELCENLIPRYVDKNFIPSSGSDNGGDGGLDGWSIFGENSFIKYAFSIQQSSKEKIRSEILKCNYKNIRFFTNQLLSQKLKEDIKKDFSDRTLEFWDIDAIASIICEHEELGRYIGLKDTERKLDIAYIKQRQIFDKNNKIDIPKHICYVNPRDGNVTISDLDNILDLDYPFILLKAPAGYGKSKALEYIYNKILNEEDTVNLPPLFITVANYTGNNFFNLIDEPYSGWSIQDCLLLLDGYDEIDTNHITAFNNDLKSFLSANGSFTRKVIITCRTSSYYPDLLAVFKPFEVTLSGITSDAIKTYVYKKINNDIKAEALLKNQFFLKISSNVFYLTNLVDFYIEKQEIANSVVSLFDYIIHKELVLQSRKENITSKEYNAFESLALYMVLNQKIFVSNEILDAFDIKSQKNNTKFSFSHKSILEYLAAMKVCRQGDSEEVKRLLYSNSRVVPYLLNVYGFVINIFLNNSNWISIFKDLLKYQLSTNNGLALLSLEADKITEKVNFEIIKTIFDNNSYLDYCKDSIKEIVDFFVSGNLNDNLDYLKEKIQFADKKTYHFYSYFLLSLLLNYQDKISEPFQKDVYEYFISLLNKKSDNNIIESLFYSISQFSYCEKRNKDFDFVFDEMLAIGMSSNDSSSLVDCLTSYIKSSKRIPSAEEYIKIYDLLIVQLTRESDIELDNLENQIGENDTSVLHHFIFFQGFIQFSERFFNERKDLFWKFINYLVKQPKILIDENTEVRSYFSLLSKIITHEIAIGNVEKEDYENVLKILLNSPSAFDNHFLWNEFFNSLPFSKGLKIIKEILVRSNANFYYYHFLRTYCQKTIITNEDFELFRKEFEKTEILLSFYNDYCSLIPDNSPLFNYVLPLLPEEIKTAREKYKKESAKYNIDINQIHLKKAKKDYHILFNGDLLLNEVENTFNLISKDENKEIILRDDFFTFTRFDYDNPDKEMINEFMDYWFKLFLRQTNEIYKTQIINIIQADSWEIDSVIQFILFAESNSILYSDLTPQEVDVIIKWGKKVLDLRPLCNANSELFHMHRFLAHLLRKTDFFEKDEDFLNNYSDKLYGLIFSGFPNTVTGMWQNDYEYYSLDYLEKFITKPQLQNFIYKNINQIDFNKDNAIAVFGYLANEKKNGTNFGLHYDEILESISAYISKNLKESSAVSIIQIAYDLGFSIKGISKGLLKENIILNEHKNALKFNYAYYLLYEHRFVNDDELRTVLDISKEIFNESKDLLIKKIIAEQIIALTQNAGDVFEYYVNYLLDESKKPTISQVVYNQRICTADINHIPIIEKLFKYLSNKNIGFENPLYYCMNNIVVNSYKAMAKNCKSNIEFQLVITSLQNCIKEKPYYANFMDEINNEYAQRMHKSLSVEDIKKLK